MDYENGGENENVEYLYQMGELYRIGEEVPQNNYLAMEYHERAVEKGCVNSYVPLSMIYNDIAKLQNQYAKQYYEEKAFHCAYAGYRAGVFGAAAFLAMAYAFEMGVKHNYELAIKYYKEAIIEYKRVNVADSTISYMESFLKEVEEQNRLEKAILYGSNKSVKAKQYNLRESISKELSKFIIFVVIALVSYLIFEFGGSGLFIIVYAISAIIAIRYLIGYIIMKVKEYECGGED